MPLFLTDHERATIQRGRDGLPLNQFLWALQNRCLKRAANPGLIGHDTSVEWWHCYAEYVTDAAMAHALKPDALLGAWLRNVVMGVVQRPLDDWVGPWFRNHTAPPTGHLETAHLAWGTAIALDLAPGIFSDEEREEIRAVLRERAIPMCRRWLDRNAKLANWPCILLAGLTAAAAVLEDDEQLDYAVGHFRLLVEAFQPDGSYAESLQYSNYAMYGLMIVSETLLRSRPELAGALPIGRYGRGMRWHAASLFYMKPLDGWGAYPRPRAANFNDSAAMFAPHSDVLLHIATRCRDSLPTEAGLARWIQEHYCPPLPDLNSGNSSTFGFINKFGFLSLPLLAQAAPSLSPVDAKLPELAAFSNGDVLVRDQWDGRTILAIHGGGDHLHGPGHLQGDLNSFILVHRQERLLADPGHSCYRNLMRTIDISTQTHNAVTFRVPGQRTVLEQSTTTAGRRITDGQPGPPIDRGARRLIAVARDDLRVIGSEAAALYGDPITEYTRIWILCGEHALFIFDRIRASQPVQTIWHWLLNNRDGQLHVKPVLPDRMVIRRGVAGMKLFNCSGARFDGFSHGCVHDCYHPLPNQQGEGAPGSGTLMRWCESEATTERLAVHAIALDDYAAVAAWHLRRDGDAIILEGPAAREQWRLDTGDAITITELTSARRYQVTQRGSDWDLT